MAPPKAKKNRSTPKTNNKAKAKTQAEAKVDDTKKESYSCQLCEDPDCEEMVACDVCDKWCHFICVDITSIGEEDEFICPNCKENQQQLNSPISPPKSTQYETIVTSTSSPIITQQLSSMVPITRVHTAFIPPQQGVTAVRGYNLRYVQSYPFSQMTAHLDYVQHNENTGQFDRFRNEQEITRTSQIPQISATTTPERILHEVINKNPSIHSSQRSQNHRNEIRSELTVKSNETNRRQQIELNMIEERRQLQEERDNIYLTEKYRVLMGSYHSSESSEGGRTKYTREWVDKHSTQSQEIYKESENLETNEQVMRRFNEIRFGSTQQKESNPQGDGWMNDKDENIHDPVNQKIYKRDQLHKGQTYQHNQPPAFESKIYSDPENKSTKQPFNEEQIKPTLIEDVATPLPGAGRTLSSAQIAARHVVKKQLPNFDGKPEDWPMFLSRFENSTELCGYSNSENLDRLQDCLKGNALEAVRSRLLTAESVPQIIETLRMLYGRPELIVNSLLKKIRNENPPHAEKLNTLVDFALSVKNVCATLEQAKMFSHLHNPALVQELVEKLPTNFKIEWAKYRATKLDITLSTLGDWLYNLASVISTVTEPTVSKKTDRKPENKSENKPKKEPTKKDLNFMNVHQNSGEVNTVQSDNKPSDTSKKPSQCIICQKKCSKLEDCTVFLSYDVDQRWKAIYNHKLCRRCLNRHGRFCFQTKECGVRGCTFKHHQLLHDDKKHSSENVSQEKEKSIVKRNNNVHSSFDRSVLLRIVPVTLYSDKRYILTFAYLDDGSDLTMIDEEIIKMLMINGSNEPLCLFWTGDVHRNEKNSKRINLEISGQKEFSTRFKLNDVRSVETLGLPSQTVKKEELIKRFPYLSEIPLIDYIDATPRILIGCDNTILNSQQDLVEGDINQPVASKCRLGWSIHGRIKGNSGALTSLNNYHRRKCPSEIQFDEIIHQQVKDFFSIENFGVRPNNRNLNSKEDERALDILNKFTKRVDGRYETALLWKYDSIDLPNSYEMAKKRLQCFEKHKPKMIETVTKTINDYIRKGYVSKLSADDLKVKNSKIWYLPTFTVSYPKKPDKIRTVFDAAAKVHDVSLNSMLLKGPDQLVSLLDILRRFRERSIAVTGDIQEMFHQVKIREEDKHAQPFLWRDGDVSKEPDQYVMNVMTFGATCSPSAAHFVKNLNASQFEQDYPRAVKGIVENHYVDDWLDCVHTNEEMIDLIQDVKRIHKFGGFEIRKFLSNSAVVMKEFGELNNEQEKSLQLDHTFGTERVLGMWWNTMNDKFTFSLKYVNIDKNILNGLRIPTKREVLKILMSIFDPLGLVSNYLIHLKIILQDIWRSDMDWDQEITNPEITAAWKTWIEILTQVEEVEIPRLYSSKMSPNEPDSVELHVFVDASEKAFAAVVYLRVESHEGVDCVLVGSKSRVAPLKYLSIPRLELQSGILGARLLSSICNGQTFKVNRRCIWTDSTTLLSWIQSDHRKYHQFVAHRIGEILESTNISEWRWIPTKQNVADDATKWTKNINFHHTNRWFSGPDFLRFSEDKWPTNEKNIEKDTPEEMKINFAHTKFIVPNLINAENFSDWKKLIRAMAYARRYILILRARISKEKFVKGPLSREELVVAEKLIFRQAQYENFLEEMVILKRNQTLPMDERKEIRKSSQIYKCSPYLDEFGLLRIHGRIDLANDVLFDTKRPIILPNNNKITRLLITNYHEMYHHRNNRTVYNEIRQKFYIPHLRVALNSIRNKDCQRCMNKLAKPQPPEMAILPKARLAIGFRPFTYLGIDYFGPIYVAVGRASVKRWGVIFTCLTVRAIKIEIAYSLDTNSCIMCVRNFIDLYGPPLEIYSDCGTNMKGMDNEFKSLMADIDMKTMATTFTSTYTQWCFNPPKAPHMGGSWERLIRSVKTSLYEIMPTRNPTDDVLRNLLMEVVNIVNSRPLTYIPLEHDEEEALTPNHFLLGSSNGLKPMIEIEDTGPILYSKWKENQRLANLFWQRLTKEYLPDLTRRTKWFDPVDPLKIGDIVLIIDKENKRNQYPKARVIDVVKDSIGQVRRVRVQKANKSMPWRPATGLAKLDVHRNTIDSLTVEPGISQTGGSVMNGNTGRAKDNPANGQLNPQY